MKNESELRVVEVGGGQEVNRAKPTIKSQKTASKPKDARILPSARVVCEKQLAILRAYDAASGPGRNPVTIQEVSEISSVAASTIAMLNGFFCDIGLIHRIDPKGGKFLPSQDVASFAKAYNWNPETAAQKLAPLLANSWFADPLLRMLSFNAIDEKSAIETLAEKAGVGPEYKPQVRVLLEYLQVSGLILVENGTVRASKHTIANPALSDHDVTGSAQTSKDSPTARPTAISTAFSQAAQGVVNFHVDVKINMDEFAQWSPERINAFFSGIAQVLAAKGAIEKEASKENTN